MKNYILNFLALTISCLFILFILSIIHSIIIKTCGYLNLLLALCCSVLLIFIVVLLNWAFKRTTKFLKEYEL